MLTIEEQNQNKNTVIQPLWKLLIKSISWILKNCVDSLCRKFELKT